MSGCLQAESDTMTFTAEAFMLITLYFMRLMMEWNEWKTDICETILVWRPSVGICAALLKTQKQE